MVKDPLTGPLIRKGNCTESRDFSGLDQWQGIKLLLQNLILQLYAVGTSDTVCIASIFVSISILPFPVHFLLLEEGDISKCITTRGSDTPMTNIILECVQN